MKLNSILMGIGCLVILCCSESTNAQIHLPGFLSNQQTNTNPSPQNPNPGDQSPDVLMQTFIASEMEVLAAQSLLAQAYDLKDQAELCDAQAKALQSTGIDTDTLQKTVDISNQVNDAISAQQDNETTLSDQEKKYYTQSLPHFTKGVIGLAKTIAIIVAYTKNGKGLTALAVGGVQGKGIYFIGRHTPVYSKNVFGVFRKTMSISHSNGVKIPSDATSALGSLG